MDGNQGFRLTRDAGQAVIIPEKPVALFNYRKKLMEEGISNFGIDLSFTDPDKAAWEKLSACFEKNANPAGSLKFNFKNGLL